MSETARDKAIQDALRSTALITALLPDGRTTEERSLDWLAVLKDDPTPVAQIMVGLTTYSVELVSLLSTLLKLEPQEILQMIAVGLLETDEDLANEEDDAP